MQFIALLAAVTLLFSIIEILFGRRLSDLELSQLPEIIFPRSVNVDSLTQNVVTQKRRKEHKLVKNLSQKSVNDWLVVLVPFLIILGALYVILSHQFDDATQKWAIGILSYNGGIWAGTYKRGKKGKGGKKGKK